MCWQGVRFKRNENCISQNREQESQSTPSRVLPTPSYRDFNEGEEKESKIERVGLKQTIDGVDCKNSSPVNDRHNRRYCCLCGRTFPYDLTPYFNNGQSGYICSNCHIYGPPSEPAKEDGSQSKLELEGSEGVSPA